MDDWPGAGLTAEFGAKPPPSLQNVLHPFSVYFPRNRITIHTKAGHGFFRNFKSGLDKLVWVVGFHQEQPVKIHISRPLLQTLGKTTACSPNLI